MKIVFELSSYVMPTGISGINYSTIETRIKLEWLDRGRWRPATEMNNKTLSNFSARVSTLSAFGTYSNNTNIVYRNQHDGSNLIEILGGAYINGTSPYWSADVRGNYSAVVTASGHSSGNYNVPNASWFWQ
ncbi:hypothetical protein [Rhodoflexus caldus]|uniref:hypothetical protein n=1 Tax=Rhodoflexus caldus TaxID=2891236 RepID=UPI002029D41D|nr:hypothetical protein [Rhodoflexus caldus]